MPNEKDGFFVTLNNRVDQYFKENNLNKQGGWKIKVKSLVMLTIYFAPYFYLLFGSFSSMWVFYSLWILMGLGMSFIGLAVMHDANHGVYSRNKFINKMAGGLIALLGGYSTNWIIQHNVLHHTYTNVDGLDEDINPAGLLRFSPHRPLRPWHKGQHVYAFFLYGLMTLTWCTIKDFRQLIKFNRDGLLKTQKSKPWIEWTRMIASKVLYYAYILAIPLIFTDYPWYHIVLGFLAMHYLSGLILALIFQPAHVMETSEYPLPNDNKTIEFSWAASQLYNTCNYSPNAKIFSYFVGGLNFQIEHHLFPNICHVYYKDLSPIVQEVAKQFNLPYHVQPTFASAVIEHGRMLKQLGR